MASSCRKILLQANARSEEPTTRQQPLLKSWGSEVSPSMTLSFKSPYKISNQVLVERFYCRQMREVKSLLPASRVMRVRSVTVLLWPFHSKDLTKLAILHKFQMDFEITCDSAKIKVTWHCQCGFIDSFLINTYLILQISHAEIFKMRYTRCPYNNSIQRYSWKCWKIAFHGF